MNFRLLAMFLLAHFCAAAQDSTAIQSLQTKLQAAKDDTAKVWLYNSLFVEYRDYDSAAAMDVLNKGIELSHDIDYKKGESQLLLNKGSFLNINGENTKAEAVMKQALKIRTAIGDVAGQGYCLRSLGTIQYDKNDFDAALKYYLQSAEKFEAAKDEKGLSGTYIWIGSVFNQGLFQYDKAEHYYNKSLEIATRLKDSISIGYNYNNLGNVYYNAKKFEPALTYYKKSRTLREQLGDELGVGVAFGNIANIYFDTKNYPLALAYNDSSLKIRQALNDKKGIAATHANLGNVYLAMGRLEDCFAAYTKAIAWGNEIDYREPVIESYNGLSNYYEKKGNTTMALEYYKKYKTASDSVYNSDISNQIQTLEKKFETASKEKLIQQQQFDISRRNYMLAGSVILLVLGSLLGYSYYRRYKLKKEKQLQQEIMHQQDLATRAVLQAEEAERQRIAQELHDGVGQMMSAAKMNLSAMENDLQFKSDNQKISYDRVVALVDDSCKEVRTVSHQMMPNALLKSGLGNAIRDFVDKIDNRVIKVDLYTEGMNERIDQQTETVLYRVVQECVNNVIKHSGANHLDISLIKDDDGISVTIEDNGKGFNISEKMKVDGIGLKNIVTRIQYLKGTVDFDSAFNRGTLVAIHVPVV